MQLSQKAWVIKEWQIKYSNDQCLHWLSKKRLRLTVIFQINTVDRQQERM
jgi:hypothetical protein